MMHCTMNSWAARRWRWGRLGRSRSKIIVVTSFVMPCAWSFDYSIFSSVHCQINGFDSWRPNAKLAKDITFWCLWVTCARTLVFASPIEGRSMGYWLWCR
jgi:hypothetical protein